MTELGVHFSHRDPGPGEAAWLAVIEAARLPALVPDASPTLVVAPHPDDETLGAGGLIATLLAAGARVEVLCLTDGEAPSGVPDLALARRRRGERGGAMAHLGVEGVTSLGLPDGELSNLGEGTLVGAIGDALGGSRRCVGPFAGDGHPDHAATGEACRRVCASREVELLSYPIWAWHWSEARADGFLRGGRILPLGPDEALRKRRAIGAYASQTSGDDPIIGSRVLAHFTRSFEVFLA